ncbi:MAG: hypothetical protein LBI09_00605, partial [Nitrososphaerota archaeon]|nr:hypothetical protein [Nitrososphaerota archaeon]
VAEWLSRQPRDLKEMGFSQNGKIAGRFCACRGSSPFPGALLFELINDRDVKNLIKSGCM